MAHIRQRLNNKNEMGIVGKSYKTIYGDENTRVTTRPIAIKQKQSKGANSKRTVLGALSTNVHGLRGQDLDYCPTTCTDVDLSRLGPDSLSTNFNLRELGQDPVFVKQKIPHISSKPSFSIFDDEAEQSDVTSTEVPQSLVQSESTRKQSECLDSPMRIDKSFDDTPSTSNSKQRELCCYVQENFEYMKELERKIRPKPHYMRKQPDITHGMRSILVDWLVEVAEEYKLELETLYLSISYIDRFLSTMSVLRSKLQLVGTASMFVASKYEEIYPPDVKEFVYITDETYTKKQVLRMEQLILKVLSFDLAIPTPIYFLECFCSWSEVPLDVQHLAQYLCELSLLSADPYLRFLPSELACAAFALANHTLDFETWPSDLALRTGIDFNDFSECFECLHATFCEAPVYPQQAVREKYSSSRYRNVALYTPHPLPSS